MLFFFFFCKESHTNFTAQSWVWEGVFSVQAQGKVEPLQFSIYHFNLLNTFKNWQCHETASQKSVLRCTVMRKPNVKVARKNSLRHYEEGTWRESRLKREPSPLWATPDCGILIYDTVRYSNIENIYITLKMGKTLHMVLYVQIMDRILW